VALKIPSSHRCMGWACFKRAEKTGALYRGDEKGVFFVFFFFVGFCFFCYLCWGVLLGVFLEFGFFWFFFCLWLLCGGEKLANTLIGKKEVQNRDAKGLGLIEMFRVDRDLARAPCSPDREKRAKKATPQPSPLTSRRGQAARTDRRPTQRGK